MYQKAGPSFTPHFGASQVAAGHHLCKVVAGAALAPFFSALRFRVAVIFKGLHGVSSALLSVLSKRVLVSVSLDLVGDGFVIGVRSGSRWSS